MSTKLREVLEQNKERYIEELKNLIAIDTHDIGHGIAGGLEAEGQDYMIRLFESMGADEIVKDDMDEAVIQECFEKHQEGNLGHNQENRYNVYATFNIAIDGNTSDTNINEILCYIIMKQKGYKIGYDCYKRIKNNKLLSLLCKK